MNAEPSTYYLCASPATNQRLDDYSDPHEDDESYDPSNEPQSRATKIFSAAFTRVNSPDRGWTMWLQRSAAELDDDDYCRLDTPEGTPLARFRTEVLFRPSLPLEYELLQPEWVGTPGDN